MQVIHTSLNSASTLAESLSAIDRVAVEVKESSSSQSSASLATMLDWEADALRREAVMEPVRVLLDDDAFEAARLSETSSALVLVAGEEMYEMLDRLALRGVSTAELKEGPAPEMTD